MTRTGVMMVGLWLALLATALAAVLVSQDCRRIYMQLAKHQRTEHQLQVDWGRYLLERSTLASPGRIEKLAAEQYGLRAPALQEIIMVQP
ncbi:MAG: cell division protein FtsL [Gammaproteobacteria bacterium]|nr:cell division protein FtsL [Gammaproteobacteria bacterium]